MARKKIDWNSVASEMDKLENKNSYETDEGAVFKPKTKQDGTGSFIVRFLEPPKEEALPFAKIYNHGFQSANKMWFIENCPTTKMNQCPVCTENSRIWDDDEQTARPRSRKLSYWTNVMVVKDDETPDNVGKVFKYRFGVKIWEKIKEELDDNNQVFDYEAGSNFKLKIKLVKSGSRSYPNYDSSSFSDPSPIGLGKTPFTESEIDAIHEQAQPLAAIVADKEFKSYSELATLFTKKTSIPVPTSVGGSVGGASAERPVQTPVAKAVVETVVDTAVDTVVDTETASDTEFFDILQND